MKLIEMLTGEREVSEHGITSAFKVTPSVDKQVDYNKSDTIYKSHCWEKWSKTADTVGLIEYAGVLKPAATSNNKESQ